MTALIDVPVSVVVTASEARTLTDAIKRSANQLWALLLEAHDKRAWVALGYPSWREYAKAEFSFGQSQGYRLLDQGRVIRALEQGANSPIGEIVSEKVARDIKPHLAAVVADVQERVADGADPQDAVEAAIGAVRLQHGRRYLSSRKRVERPSRYVATIALELEAMTASMDIDYGLLDRSMVMEWSTSIRKSARALLQFAARLERELVRARESRCPSLTASSASV